MNIVKFHGVHSGVNFFNVQKCYIFDVIEH
jgi:hypothetical protein